MIYVLKLEREREKIFVHVTKNEACDGDPFHEQQQCLFDVEYFKDQ